MKRVLLIIGLFLISVFGVANEKRTFSEEDKKFISELEKVVFKKIEFQEVPVDLTIKYLKLRTKVLAPEMKNLKILYPESDIKTKITMYVHNLTLKEILYGICITGNYSFKVEKNNTIILTDKGFNKNDFYNSNDNIKKLKEREKEISETLNTIIFPTLDFKKGTTSMLYSYINHYVTLSSKKQNKFSSILIPDKDSNSKLISIDKKDVSLKRILKEMCNQLKCSYSIDTPFLVIRE